MIMIFSDGQNECCHLRSEIAHIHIENISMSIFKHHSILRNFRETTVVTFILWKYNYFLLLHIARFPKYDLIHRNTMIVNPTIILAVTMFVSFRTRCSKHIVQAFFPKKDPNISVVISCQNTGTRPVFWYMIQGR
jgi:hypothetical protein